MRPRWWKRLWLRYLFYFKQHWIIAGTVTLWVLWVILQLGWQLLPLLLEFLISVL